VFNQSQQNAGAVAGQVAQVLKTLRSALTDAGNVCGWVVAQSAADLEAIGFDAADVTQMQAVLGGTTAAPGIMVLVAMASGGPPPTVTVNYVEQAIDLIGPQA
jgi:hypothetical protein